jgi:uncharacterized protein
MLSSPTGREEMATAELDLMLREMIDCGQEFERQLVMGNRYPFLNMFNSLREIHRGTHRPYPCGAGAGYLGVSAEGELFACHRFVDDPDGSMGHSTKTLIRRGRISGWPIVTSIVKSHVRHAGRGISVVEAVTTKS